MALSPRPPFLILLISSLWVLMAQSAPITQSTAYKVIAVKDGGRISGSINFKGAVPQPREFKVGAAAKVCGAKKARQPIVVVNGALTGVVVTLRGVTQGKAPGEAPTIQVQQCELVPRIQGMVAGQRLTLRNLDDMAHRVSGESSEGGALFDFFQPMQGSKHRKLVDDPGLLRVQAGPNMPWATAWVYVAPHPYVAISGADGAFDLRDIPPGSYELLAWHEVLGTQSMSIELEAGQALDIDFTFQGGEE